MIKRNSIVLPMLLAWGVIFLTAVSQAEGGLSLSQTRVVFDGKAKSAKVTLNNQSDRVYLVNSRVLATPDGSAKQTEALPFIVTPPLFRLEKQSRNTILISRNDTSVLPAGRESIFYLSFLAIPSVKKNGEAEDGMTTQVSFGIRTVIKLFYRPSGLEMPVSAAPEKLTFVQQGSQLKVTNPTPYYLTLAQLQLDGQPVNVREQGAMISPFSSQSYQVKGPANEINWSVINDYGGLSETFHWTR
ncbi:molecular chaperone [Providencia burhodogranariea]|uniref:Putative fimbrial chaperone n=1 Tax=Providencia burhodogranariea DSM 19968 TaxID=1141662 RepID=K8X0P5_9GAMM|nr:molecular chaperone [Providencia burhodogranariea]EKT62035.1 putative fimbrial chaperone [Providencia burhodogranariea DSM 19968]